MTWPKEHIWQYSTQPFHPFDVTFWFLLRPLMITLGKGKITHWWHWRRTPIGIFKSLRPIIIKGDPTAFEVKPKYKMSSTYASLDLVRMSLGGWKNSYVLKPKDDSVEKWQFAFPDYFHPDEELILCTIILEGPVKVLRGPKDKKVYGFDLDGNGVDLEIVKYLPRTDKSVPWPQI